MAEPTPSRPVEEQVAVLRHEHVNTRATVDAQQVLIARLLDDGKQDRERLIRLEVRHQALEEELFGKQGRGGDNEGEIGQLKSSVKHLITMSWGILVLLIVGLVSLATTLIAGLGKK